MAGATFWTSTVLLLSAAFIPLSEAAGELRRCYWCGPLAEQVHRSPRSAPCGAADQVTTCEPGYNYCAIVATSPPRVESRYCVKLYQDECYPLFCNSTKTWKMTCPCRGDLCNGPNAERETEAFALLPKLVAKTHYARVKKRTPNASPHLIKQDAILTKIRNGNINHESEKLIVNESDDDSDSSDSSQHSENMQSDQPVNIVVEHHDEQEIEANNIDTNAQSTTASNQLIEIEIYSSDPTVGPDVNVQPCTGSPSTTKHDELSTKPEQVKQEEISIATTIETIQNNEAPLKTTENKDVGQSPTTATNTVHQDTVEVKSTEVTHSDTPIPITKIISIDEPNKPSESEEQMQNDAPVVNPTDSIPSVKTTEEIMINQPDSKDTKSSEGKPTAEALQQNGSPIPVTEKSTQATATETTTTTFITTRENIDTMTTTPATKRKNDAGRVTFSYILIVSCFVFL